MSQKLLKKMILSSLLIPTFTSISCSKQSNPPTSHFQIPTASSQKSHIKILLLSNLASLAFALTLNSPLPSLAIPSLNSRTSLLPPITPFSQSQDLQIGLENGKIRPCPSTNPGCVSTNPKSSSFAFPWEIPESFTENAIQKLQDAILKTQKNAKIQVIEDTADGKYLQAEVDGGFGRDVLEFLVKKDVVVYRSMATKVTYVYPFTTALGDSKGQQERMKKILQELGWYEPSFEWGPCFRTDNETKVPLLTAGYIIIFLILIYEPLLCGTTRMLFAALCIWSVSPYEQYRLSKDGSLLYGLLVSKDYT